MISKFNLIGISLGIFSAIIFYKAYVTEKQLYLISLAIAESNLSISVVVGFLIYVFTIIGIGIINFMFGSLRSIELEHIYEKSWFTITESFLVLTIFRDDFDSTLILLFTFLLYLKILHWISIDRIDLMDQTPNLNISTAIKLSIVLNSLIVLEGYLLYKSIQNFREFGPSSMILFTFEYAILLLHSLTLLVKFIVNVIEHQRDAPLENKSMFIFYLELIYDFIKLLLYFAFFLVILVYYGIPLNIVRDLYLTFRSFVKRITDFIRYQQATANMNERYPDATQEELNQTDRICIICREEMETAKKLNCGHLFHFRCLRSWLERQQSCPTCRTSVFDSSNPALNSGAQNANVNNNNANQDNNNDPNNQANDVPQNLDPNEAVTSTYQYNNIVPFNGDINENQSYILTPIAFPPREILESLSEDELKEIEGELKDNLIKRIQVLQSLQADISHIIFRMNQYNSKVDSNSSNK